jgi:pilus assembly protein CpaB
MVVLSVAFAAAGGAALLVRAGVGNRAARPATVVESVPSDEVLVAATDVAVGHSIDAMQVRWQKWPKEAINASYVVRSKQPDLTKDISGAIARTPLVAGEPLTGTNVVRAGATGFMAATLTPGYRAIAVPVTVETSAGGFILPNDRVDVILTRDVSGGSGTKRFLAETVLKDVRILAMDQTVQQDKDKQTVIARTATLELRPEQTEVAAQSVQAGTLSLALRSLGDSNGVPLTVIAEKKAPPAPVTGPRIAVSGGGPRQPQVFVYRYGVLQPTPGQAGTAGSGPGGGSVVQTAAAGELP